ncbi:hypothetical protein BJ508DRAFT_311840 [Ascobolus immersus RN42]|uniref:Uncharacterized protein n=1 Tax=Ascobolus immersus RN42 TaxID=1160509 RepID=A0A3N4HQF4_ASCIM|nr:hypothetical protein BJ508DRAFT_311840 [Ascobolus immersus RN42]
MPNIPNSSSKRHQHFNLPCEYIPSKTRPYRLYEGEVILMPQDKDIPTSLDDYEPFEEACDYERMKQTIHDFWNIPRITQILIPSRSWTRAGSSLCYSTVYRVLTAKKGVMYEYTDTWTSDYGSGPQLLRHLWEDGTRGPWIQGTLSAESIERIEREQREWRERGKVPITAERHAALFGVDELKWMETGRQAVNDRRHAALFWVLSGKPGVETEEERKAFEELWEKHVETGCIWDRRKKKCGPIPPEREPEVWRKARMYSQLQWD